MIKSWLGWLWGDRDEAKDRRAEVPRPVIEISPRDIDPLTGALRWDRFLAMFNAEQEQAPGVLLLVDLSTRSESIDMIARHKEWEILPWLAQAIRQAIRSDDLLSHVDGYRFATLLRGAPQDVGTAICERILESVDNTIFMTADGIANLDVKIGGVVFQAAGERDVLEEAQLNLDRAQNSRTTYVLH